MKKQFIPIIFIWSVITVCLLVGFGKFAHNLVEKEQQIQVTETLNSILVSNVTALKYWVKEKERYTIALANRPENLQKLRSVLTQAQNANRGEVQLQDFKEVQWLKNNLFSEAQNYGFTGFLLFDIHGNVLTTNSDTSIKNLHVPSELLQKSLQGKTSLSKPFQSTVPLKDQNGIYRDNWPTMLASTPVYDLDGNVLGGIAFRIPPETDFIPTINIAKPGLTGKTYAVDKYGRILLESVPWSSKDNIEAMEKNISPQPRMARILEQDVSRVDVSGYSNFRGIHVVGAWVWVKDLDLGLVTEMEFAEAFKAIQTLKSVLGAIFGLMIMISGIGIIFHMRKKNNQDLLLAAKEKAEQENQLKTQCLSHMSEGLRSPMNSIVGFTQMLESDPDGPLNKSQAMAVEQITRAGEHLMELITETLDLSVVESGNSTLNPEPCDVTEVIADVLLKAQSLADEHKIELVDQTENLDACMVMADRSALKRVLFNLISNAILYNRQNGKVVLEYEKPERDLINISVTDTGPGIAKDQYRAIFRPFERLGIEDSDIKGRGIGLVLVKNLLEQMGGRLNISSTLGQGSCFSIQFPVLNSEEIPNHEMTIQEEESSEFEENFAKEALLESTPASESKQNHEPKSMFHRVTSKKILYILDNETNLGVVQQILKRRTNFELLSAQLFDSGIEQARKCLPDMILVDIDFSGKDGIDTLKKLKTYLETRDIPVIALSAEASENQIKEVQEMGIQDCINKPVQTNELLEAIDKILQPLTLTTIDTQDE